MFNKLTLPFFLQRNKL